MGRIKLMFGKENGILEREFLLKYTVHFGIWDKGFEIISNKKSDSKYLVEKVPNYTTTPTKHKHDSTVMISAPFTCSDR